MRVPGVIAASVGVAGCLLLAAGASAQPVERSSYDPPDDIVQRYVATAQDVERVALVIGNADYRHITPLPKSLVDGQDMAAALKGLKFHVLTASNVDRAKLVDEVYKLQREIKPDAIVFVYFSGHGFSHDGRNYLAPVDHDPNASQQVLEQDNVPVEWVIDHLKSSRYGSLLVALDSCRNTPTIVIDQTTKAARPNNGAVSYAPPQETKALIAFAAAPARFAWTGNASMRNSVFTGVLLNLLPSKGKDIHTVTREVRRKVFIDSSQRQEPWSVDALYGAVWLNPDDAQVQLDEQNWRRTLVNADRDSVAEFIDLNPTSRFVHSARRWLDDHKQQFSNAPPPATTTLSGNLQSSKLGLKTGTLAGTNVFANKSLTVLAEPSSGARQVGTLEPTQQAKILTPPDQAGWTKVLTTGGAIGYVPDVKEIRINAAAVRTHELSFARDSIRLAPAHSTQIQDIASRYASLKNPAVKVDVDARHPSSAAAATQIAFGRAMELRNEMVRQKIGRDRISIALSRETDLEKRRDQAVIQLVEQDPK